jgi:hypothetical protein
MNQYIQFIHPFYNVKVTSKSSEYFDMEVLIYCSSFIIYLYAIIISLRKSSCLTIFSSFSASAEDLSGIGLYSQVDKTYKKYTYDYTYPNF